MDPVKPIEWMLIAFIFLHHCVLGNSEVQSDSETCFKAVSCKGKCSKKEQWDNGTTQTAPHCHCDPSCTKYKDCCRDYPIFCGNQTARSSSDPEFVCRRINDKEPRIWMIESCPRGYKNKAVRNKCDSTQAFRADIILDQIPLYDLLTDLHYKNKYCAECHGVMDDFLFYFDMRIKCELRPPAVWNSTQTLAYMLEHCSSVQMQLTKEIKRRHCYPTRDSCPDGASIEARRECLQSLPAVVYDAKEKKNYVNIQCMACHASVSATRNAVCGPQPVKENIFNPKSFEVVMNFENKIASGGLEIKKRVVVTCKEGDVYDEHLEICRKDIVTGPTKGVSDKYRVKMWLSPLDGEKPENFSRSEFIKVLTTRISPLDPQQVDIISLMVEDRSTTVLFDLHAKYHNISASESNDTLDLNALLDFKQSFTMVVVRRTWNVFKVTTRRLSCTKSEVYGPGQYTYFVHNESVVVESNGKLDYLSPKQYYYIYKDNKMYTNGTTVVVCRSFFGVVCNHSMLAAVESEYTIFKNKSLLFKPTGQWFMEEEYDMRGKTPWICTKYKFKKRESNDTGIFTPILNKPNIHVEIRRYMTIIGFSISIISLFIVLLTHGILRDLRIPLPGKNLMSLSLSLFLAHFWYLLGSGDTDKPVFCRITAYILHYLFLVSFGCTFIVAYDTRRTFSVKTAKAHAVGGSFQAKRLAAYLFISWGIPFVFVFTCATLDWLDVVAIGYGKGEACWIANATASLVVFATPVGLVLVYNVLAFSQTVYAINKARNQAQRTVKSNHYTRPDTVKIYMRLVSLMGFSWFFGISSPLIHHGLMYPFVFFTTLQGLYIFLAFVFKAKVLRMIKVKLPLKKRKPVRRPTKGTVSTMADSTPYNKYTSSCKDETQI